MAKIAVSSPSPKTISNAETTASVETEPPPETTSNIEVSPETEPPPETEPLPETTFNSETTNIPEFEPSPEATYINSFNNFSAHAFESALTSTTEIPHEVVYKKSISLRELMTKPERIEYKRAMQTAKNVEAREQIRELVYTRLKQRAKELGIPVVNYINNHITKEATIREQTNLVPNHVKHTEHFNALHTTPHPVHPAHPLHPIHPRFLPPRH
jgi:hypothetical protein